MKILFALAALLLAGSSIAQNSAQAYTAVATGSIYVPSLQSISVDLLQEEAVVFSKAEDFDQGKIFPNFIRVTVVSNTPYLVSVMASGDRFSASSYDAPSIPVSIISLKDNFNSQFVGISPFAKPLLINKNTQVKSVYMVDARFNPGWEYPGGQYGTTLTFTLTAQ